MNVENLKEGMRLKSYRELCGVIGEKVKTSNSKEAQLKELRQYIKYSRDGNAYIIEEVYKNIIPKEDKRTIGGYDEIGLLLLLLGVSQQEYKRTGTSTLVLSTTELLSKINAVNINYSTGRQNQKALANVLNVSCDTVNDFYNTTHDNLKRRLENNLNKLNRSRKVDYYKVKMVCTDKKSDSFREATDEEIRFILKAEESTLKKLNCKEFKDIFKKGLINNFYKIVSEELKETNIKFYYSAYKIIFNKDAIKDELESILNKEEIESLLNNKIQTNLLTNANNRVNKSLKRVEYNEKDNIRLDYYYINDIKILIQSLISNKYGDIREKIYKNIKNIN